MKTQTSSHAGSVSSPVKPTNNDYKYLKKFKQSQLFEIDIKQAGRGVPFKECCDKNYTLYKYTLSILYK